MGQLNRKMSCCNAAFYQWRSIPGVWITFIHIDHILSKCSLLGQSHQVTTPVWSRLSVCVCVCVCMCLCARACVCVLLSSWLPQFNPSLKCNIDNTWELPGNCKDKLNVFSLFSGFVSAHQHILHTRLSFWSPNLFGWSNRCVYLWNLERIYLWERPAPLDADLIAQFCMHSPAQPQ